MNDKVDLRRGARMRAIRTAMGYKEQKTFAEALGITNTRWSNVENGYPVGKDVATTLCRTFPGLDRDYIEDGEVRGLSMEMLAKLGLLPPGSSVRG
jgi:transcriptional regulator with XRE-family HTH domain